MKYKRIFTIVIDSLGIGAMEDAAMYGDEGSDTLGHIDEKMESFHIPNLRKLGLANLHPLKHVARIEEPIGLYTRLKEQSAGKDTMSGHWEMMGLRIQKPFQTFSENGFPKELIAELEKRTGRHIIGNKAASGTEILKELGERELKYNELIVYTSADSVLQICGHEEYMGLDTLYEYCRIARELTMEPKWRVGRVIARPYIGKDAHSFQRTSNRHDYALKPFGKTALNVLCEAGYDVIGIGKIRDIFDGEGIREAYTSKSSIEGMDQTIVLAQKDFCGLCFVNLVDFDAKWGHRRDPLGYGKELEAFDCKLGELLQVLKDDDLLMICADHGNDPIFKGSDHTREYVPLLLYAKHFNHTGRLRDGDSFALIGATIVDNFGLTMPKGTIGTSILKEL